MFAFLGNKIKQHHQHLLSYHPLTTLMHKSSFLVANETLELLSLSLTKTKKA